MVKLFVYGSLRQGLYDNFLIDSENFLKEDELNNYKMYSLTHYPFIIAGSGTVKGEIHEVSVSNANYIRSMEEGVGYKMVIGQTVSGVEVVYYVFERMPTHRRLELVIGGDWKKWSNKQA